jgi:hypothetical protein
MEVEDVGEDKNVGGDGDVGEANDVGEDERAGLWYARGYSVSLFSNVRSDFTVVGTAIRE